MGNVLGPVVFVSVVGAFIGLSVLFPCWSVTECPCEYVLPPVVQSFAIEREVIRNSDGVDEYFARVAFEGSFLVDKCEGVAPAVEYSVRTAREQYEVSRRVLANPDRTCYYECETYRDAHGYESEFKHCSVVAASLQLPAAVETTEELFARVFIRNPTTCDVPLAQLDVPLGSGLHSVRRNPLVDMLFEPRFAFVLLACVFAGGALVLWSALYYARKSHERRTNTIHAVYERAVVSGDHVVPNEILQLIFSFLDPPSLAVASQVCKHWCVVAQWREVQEAAWRMQWEKVQRFELCTRTDIFFEKFRKSQTRMICAVALPITLCTLLVLSQVLTFETMRFNSASASEALLSIVFAIVYHFVWRPLIYPYIVNPLFRFLEWPLCGLAYTAWGSSVQDLVYRRTTCVTLGSLVLYIVLFIGAALYWAAVFVMIDRELEVKRSIRGLWDRISNRSAKGRGREEGEEGAEPERPGSEDSIVSVST